MSHPSGSNIQTRSCFGKMVIHIRMDSQNLLRQVTVPMSRRLQSQSTLDRFFRHRTGHQQCQIFCPLRLKLHRPEGCLEYCSRLAAQRKISSPSRILRRNQHPDFWFAIGESTRLIKNGSTTGRQPFQNCWVFNDPALCRH